MKKLLIVGISDIVGGIENLFYNLFSEKSKCFDISFLCFGKRCAYEDIFLSNGYKIYYAKSRRENPFNYKRQIKDFFIEHNSFDYIWVNTTSTSMYEIQYFGKRITNAKIITHSHSTQFESSRNIFYILNRLLGLINYKKVVNNTDLFFCCSYAAGISLFGQQYKDKLVLIKNGINVERFKFNQEIRDKYRNKFNFSDSDLVIGFIGRIYSPKNPLRVVKILKKVSEMYSAAKLVVVGDGPLKQSLYDSIEKEGLLRSVRFVGFCKNVNEILNCVDVLLMPSLFEGLPLVGIEAQANGVPCLFSDEITSEVQVTNKCLFLKLSDNDQIWADGIIQLSQLHLINRNTSYIDVKNAGYDINTTKSFIEKSLISCYN